MRQRSVQQFQRLFLLISFIALLLMAWIVARTLGYGLPEADGIPAQPFVWSAFNTRIILISGHSGNDSGATCEDENGKTILTEVETVAAITQQTAIRLRRAGADVEIFQEFDVRLRGLDADVLLSIHADSCIEESGFKAARGQFSPIPQIDDKLPACIERNYMAATQLTIHINSITHNMTEYHAYKLVAPTTPAVILETGFLGGDQELLTNKQPLVAKAIADGILCFLSAEAVE